MISILSCIILEARSLALCNVHVFSVTHFRPRIPVTVTLLVAALVIALHWSLRIVPIAVVDVSRDNEIIVPWSGVTGTFSIPVIQIYVFTNSAKINNYSFT